MYIFQCILELVIMKIVTHILQAQILYIPILQVTYVVNHTLTDWLVTITVLVGLEISQSSLL